MTINPKNAAANVAQFNALKASRRLSMLPIRMRAIPSDPYKEVHKLKITLKFRIKYFSILLSKKINIHNPSNFIW